MKIYFLTILFVCVALAAANELKSFTSVFTQTLLHLKHPEFGITNPSIASSLIFERKTNKSHNHNFVPFHYDIELRLTFEEKDTSSGRSADISIPGKVRIFGSSQTTVYKLVIRTDTNTNQLGINTSSILINVQGKPIQTKSYHHDKLNGLLNIHLENAVEAGKEIEIYMEYTTFLRNNFLLGLVSLPAYDTECCKILNENKPHLIVTSFNTEDIESTSGCGNVFPCFDKYDLRSTFNLTLIRNARYTSVANGELVSSEPDSDLKNLMVEKYRWTTRIRLGLLAFGIFKNFSYVESFFGSDENKSMRIYTPGDLVRNKELLQTAANASANILNFYEDYFGTPSHLQKMMVFFAPTVFRIESLELNVYHYDMRDQVNLTPDWETESSKKIQLIQHLATTIAQQWVGLWWDPEMSFLMAHALPRYMEYLGLEVASVDNETSSALSDLAVLTDIRRWDNVFISSSQTSDKGALLLRMMEGILGRNELKIILEPYFKYLRRENETASIEDFYPKNENIYESFANFVMASTFASFSNSEDTPLVRVGIANETHFSLTQESFSKRPWFSGTWFLPVTVQTESDREVHVLEPGKNVTLFSGDVSKSIVVNPDAKGYYRTLYENTTHLTSIQNQLELNHEAMQPITRAKLLADYFKFAENKFCSYGAIFKLTQYMSSKSETSLVVWTTFLDSFFRIYAKFLSHPQYFKLENYLAPKIDTTLENVSPPLSLEKSTLRDTLLYFSCNLQTPYCQTLSRKLFSEWSSNSMGKNPLDSIFPIELRPILECAIVASGGQEAVDFMLAKYHQSVAHPNNSFTTSKNNILRALACATERDIIENLLQKTIQPISAEGFGKQDGLFFIHALINTPLGYGRSLIIHFLSSNIDNVADKLGDGETTVIVNFITSTVSYFSTAQQLNEVADLIRLHKDKLLGDANNQQELDQSYELLEQNIEWMNTVGKDIFSSLSVK